MIALKSEREVIFDLPDNTGKNKPIISQAIFNTEKINKIGWFPNGSLKKAFHIHLIL